MKRKFTLLSLLLIGFIVQVSAVPMSGSYTIGGAAPDFTTIQRAMDTLFARGVNGAVTFNIRPGTYNGQINISNIPGTSATNTITIKSENDDSTSVILTDTASLITGNFLFHVYGADYLTLKHLTLYRIGSAANCTVINLATNSRYFRLTGCIVKNDNNSGTAIEQALVYWSSIGASDSLITFDNNIFMNGSNALYLTGQSVPNAFYMPSITNNQFINQSYRTIELYTAKSPVISNNTFSTNAANFGISAIYLFRIFNDLKVNGNTLTGVSNGEAIYLDSVIGSAGAPAVISNNFIQTQGGNGTVGIYFFNSRRINTYYNSFNITGGGGASACYISNGDSNLVFKNNIMVSTGGGYTFYVSNGSAGAITASDHNDLYVGGLSHVLAYYDVSEDTTLADWTTATELDSNSVSADPLFISTTDLHVGSPAVNNTGTPVGGVTTDIDGQSRSNTTPDIGADEFTPLANNIGVIRFLEPASVSCGDSATVVSVIIKNFGMSAQGGFNVVADITGAVTSTLTENYSGSLGSNLTDTVIFSTTINTYAGGVIDVQAFTSLNTDQYHDNDSIIGSFTFLAHPATPTVPSPQQVCDNSVSITGTPDTTDVLVWYDQPSGGNILHVGNEFNPVLTTDTTFYVESHTGSGGTGCLRFTEIQPEDNPSDFVEITNVSGVGFDATGWKVLASDDYTSINVVNTITWDLGYFNPGEIRFRTDNGVDTNYWGNNLLWANGNNGWVMLIDNFNTVVDFVAWQWDSVSIANMAVFFNGDTLRPGSLWNGNAPATCVDNLSSLQRIGSNDDDDMTDWTCQPVSPGSMNSGLSSAFANCGIGLCGSIRIPVSVVLTAGVTPVALGNDTVVGNTDSLLLDAGPGYNSYLWSTGDTTQTIWAMQGTYWVMVTGGANDCSYSDTININTPVAVNSLFSSDEVSVYPNPATNRLVVSANPNIIRDAEFRITDIRGRILLVKTSQEINDRAEFDLTSLANGMYYLEIISGNKSGTKKFSINR